MAEILYTIELCLALPGYILDYRLAPHTLMLLGCEAHGHSRWAPVRRMIISEFLPAYIYRNYYMETVQGHGVKYCREVYRSERRPSPAHRLQICSNVLNLGLSVLIQRLTIQPCRAGKRY